MTIFGKILVFINLIFSLVVGALVVVVYITRTNYAAEYDKLTKRYEVSQYNAQQAQAARTKAEADRENYIKEAEGRLKANEALLRTKVDDLDRLRGQVNEDRQKNEKFDAALKAAQLEVARRQEDVVKMRDTLKTEMDKNIALVKDNNQQKDTATASQLQAAALLDRNQQLEGQVQDLARDNARIKSNIAGGTIAPARSAKNPPVENVEGLIKTTDSTGLVKISIGSDAGLARGNTLEVFRLASIPSQSKYLGTIRILEVSATEAVAQPAGRIIAPLQPGDRVASRILGS